MSNKNIAEITSGIYGLLEDLDAEQRKRVITAAMALFGDGVPAPETYISSNKNADDDSELPTCLGERAKNWIKKNSIPLDDLYEVFHINDDGNVDIIAVDLPGKNNKEKTTAAYLVCGIQGLLQSDVASLDNNVAVELCKDVGCYDKNNHTANRKALGNKISGSVKDGFTIPGPGLKSAAELIKNDKE